MDKFVVLKNISKEYPMGNTTVKALENINIDIDEGEFLSISGPSGSGKTTMLNIIGCLDSCTHGDLFLDGVNVNNFNDDQSSELRNKKIGFIFQSFNLIPVLNVYENIEFPLIISHQTADKKTCKERILNLIESVGLTEHINQRPNQLSGGQQQRVAIARSLVTKPKLVLADEPSANLDSTNSKNVLEIMLKLNKSEKITFIFSTHDPMVLEYARRIVKLKDGHIEEDRQIDPLKKDS